MLLLAPIPAEIRNGLGHAGGGRVFLVKFFHELAVALVFLKELEALGGAEDALGVKLLVGGGDFLEDGDAVLHVALVHEGVAEEDAGLVVFGLAGEFFEVGVEFVDGAAVALELLGAIGLPECGLAAVAPIGEFFEVGIHSFAGLVELLVVGKRHAPPVGGGVGARMFRLGGKEIFECRGGLHVFLGLQERKAPHEEGLGAEFRIRIFC